jgi:hypothetical protein
MREAVLGGFNTNIRYRERVYHVQTEDGGVESPNVVTLLYQGGAILFSRRSSYAEHVGAQDREARVRQLMEEQHRAMVQGLKAGRLDEKLGLAAEPALAFGEGITSERRLDELVLDLLAR